ncbi:hypothetical protein [Nocardia sp. NPDC004711]
MAKYACPDVTQIAGTGQASHRFSITAWHACWTYRHLASISGETAGLQKNSPRDNSDVRT